MLHKSGQCDEAKLEDTRLKLITSVRILQILAYFVPHGANVFKFGLVCEIDEAEDYLSGKVTDIMMLMVTTFELKC